MRTLQGLSLQCQHRQAVVGGHPATENQQRGPKSGWKSVRKEVVWIVRSKNPWNPGEGKNHLSSEIKNLKLPVSCYSVCLFPRLGTAAQSGAPSTITQQQTQFTLFPAIGYHFITLGMPPSFPETLSIPSLHRIKSLTAVHRNRREEERDKKERRFLAMSPGRPPPTEETNVSSDKVHHDGGGWELSTRMPGDMVLHERGSHTEEEDPGRSVRNLTLPTP
jgi:hypothetical protein